MRIGIALGSLIFLVLGCSDGSTPSTLDTVQPVAHDMGMPDSPAAPDGADVHDSGPTTPDASACDESHPNWTVGLKQCSAQSTPGYTLFAPLASTTTYLIDELGRQVHSWKGNLQPGNSVYLLEDGQLLRTQTTKKASPFKGGGEGGLIQNVNWDGSVKWSYVYSTDSVRQHHDVAHLPNGNILVVAWELKTVAEAEAAGRDTNLLKDNELWPEHIIEVKPQGSSGGSIVWAWHVWDHLIQDHDATKENYGKVEEHPELLDVNYTAANPKGPADWLHFNAIAYNPELDQIVVSSRQLGEIYVIDHSTTTEEAAGHSGGNSGKGGDFLYRWGNPAAYRAGSSNAQQLYGQHDAQWIAKGLPGAGNLLIFNNGDTRPGGKFSTIEEVETPITATGNYDLAVGASYGPTMPVWRYTANPPTSFYSSFISGTQRLANGNTLICSGSSGRIFEVTEAGEIVWEYINPVFGGEVHTQGQPIPTGKEAATNSVFRAYRYTADYSGLAGKELTAGDYIEKPAP
jgi:hypothetical protein